MEEDTSPSSIKEQVTETPHSLDAETPQWHKTIDAIVPAIVAIKFCTVRPFDTERVGYSNATGFVVDKNRGIVLTNRHVVRPGPVVAEGVFLNHEEVILHPIYRDPVHDFGFYRFNPKDVKFMEIAEVPLAPDEAKVGVEIRSLGNDAGEKLSILSGTLARLDRPAPEYGEDKYNDFNTFYYQSASSISGGSSGSPVINIHGRAIGMVAGGKTSAASSFFIPLQRVLRALRIIQSGNLNVPRGTLQCIFGHSPYDEVRRLGLQRDTEAKFRARDPTMNGLLIVNQVIKGGPVDGILEPGDILISMGGNPLATFLELESHLDDTIGSVTKIEIERGGNPLTLEATVGDLHAITPCTFLEMGGGILQPLSYQQAKNYRLPVGSVHVTSEGAMFGSCNIRKGSIIVSVANKAVPTLLDFENEISKFAHGQRVPVKHFSVVDRHQERVAVLYIDRSWHPMQRWVRDDEAGLWHCHPSPEPSNPEYVPKSGSASPLQGSPGAVDKALRSLVMVSFHIPYLVDGVSSDGYLGTGVIVDAEKGWVVVDKNTVPIPIGDLEINFGGTLEIPAQAFFLHPTHNFAFLKYDPKLLENSEFQQIEFSQLEIQQGFQVELVMLSRKHQPIWQTTTISKIEELFIAESKPPRFRAINEEVYHLERHSPSAGGILIDSHGKMLGLWASYLTADAKSRDTVSEIFRGLPAGLIVEVLKELQSESFNLRTLEVEWWPMNLSSARDLGLSQERIEKFKQRRQALTIRRVTGGSDAAFKLKTGDILLEIEKTAANTFKEVENIANRKEEVQLTLLRDSAEIEISVKTSELKSSGTDRVLLWAGALLQDTHHAVFQLGFVFSGVYCSRWYYGSPAHKYLLRASTWIVEVNGKATPDLNTFIAVVKEIAPNDFVRLKVVGMQDKVAVITLKKDVHYWPTYLLEKTNSRWEMIKIAEKEKS